MTKIDIFGLESYLNRRSMMPVECSGVLSEVRDNLPVIGESTNWSYNGRMVIVPTVGSGKDTHYRIFTSDSSCLGASFDVPRTTKWEIKTIKEELYLTGRVGPNREVRFKQRIA